MMGISVQLSLYPLGQTDIAPAICSVLEVLAAHKLPYEVGSMSTLVWGDDETIFAALQETFAQATKHGPAVMVITVSNACPIPSSKETEHASS